MAMGRFISAARRSRDSISGQGVRRSLRLIAHTLSRKNRPARQEAAVKAVTAGTIFTSEGLSAISRPSPAMP